MQRVSLLRASLRRLATVGFAAGLSLLSCGREVTGPDGAPRVVHGIGFVAQFPGPLASVTDGAGSVVPFDRVRVLFLRANGTVAFDRVVPFPSGAMEIPLSASLTLSPGTGAAGESFELFLRYLDPAGDTVFSGGPVPVTARPTRTGEDPPAPVDVPLAYTGPGASATSITVAPESLTVVAGESFAFTATAFDASGAAVPNAPVVWTSLDTGRATLASLAAGTGTTRATRGVARIRVALASGGGEAEGVLRILPRPAVLSLVSGGGQSGFVTQALANPVVVRLRATDSLPLAGAVVRATASGTGAVADSAITDSLGLASFTWTLGDAEGPQSLVLRSAGVDSLVVAATGDPLPLVPARLVITQDMDVSQVSGTNVGPPLTAEVRTADDELVPFFTDSVWLELVSAPAEASLTGTTRIAAVGGVATFPSWQAPRAGTYRVRVVATGLAPDTSAAFVVAAGAPASLEVVAGNAQTAIVGTTLPDPIQVRVRDAASNPVPGATVTFAVNAGGGSLVGATPVTDSAGVATLGSWTLGPLEGEQSLSATVTGVGPATITATAEPQLAVIQLSVVGSSVVGFQRSGTLRVRLILPAPAGGLPVTVTSGSPGVLSIDAPGVVTIPEGDSVATIGVFGVATGTAQVVASGPDYEPDTLNVPVSLNLISLPPTLNVPFEQTASLPVQLSPAAPAGGVWVRLQSAAPGLARTTQDSLFFAQGTATINATVEGVTLGQTTISATNPNYAPTQTTVNVTASVDIQQATLALDGSFGIPMTLRLLSGATPIPAPAGGIAIGLSAVNPECVNVPATVTIPGGLQSINVNVTYGGQATLPCSTLVRAAGPPGFAPDSATANVAVVPSVSMSGSMNVASGLQRGITLVLGSNRHGGTSVRVASSDTTRLLVSAAVGAVGADSIDVPFAVGVTTATIYIQAKEGFIEDSATVSVSAAGFTSTAQTARIWNPVFDLQNVANGTTILADRPIYVTFGTPSSPNGTFISSNDNIRAGGVPLVFSLVNDSLPVIDLVTSARVADSVTVAANPGTTFTPTTVAAGGAAIRYTATGSATIRASHPTLRPLAGATRSLTVTQPSISGLTAFAFLGYGLQRSGTVVLSSAAPEGGVQVTLRVDRENRVRLAPDATTPGEADTLVLTVPQGATSVGFSLQALEGSGGDTLTLTATAPGFTSRQSTVTLTAPVYDLLNVPTTATTSEADRAVYASIGSPSSPTGTFISFNDNLRVGAPAREVSFISDSPGIGTIVRTGLVADSLTVALNPGASNTPTTLAAGGAAIRYLAQGSASWRVVVPGMRPLAGATRATTITAPSISSLTGHSIGAGLQRSGTVIISSPAPEGGLPVTLTASRPNLFLLGSAAAAVGTDTLVVTIPQGSSSAAYYINALEGTVADTLDLVASAPGHTGRTAQIRIWQPLTQINALAGTTTTLTGDDAFEVWIGTPSSPASTVFNSNDAIRPGGVPAAFVVRTTPIGVSQLVTTGLTGDSVLVTVPVGGFRTPTSVAAGGVALRPLSTGTANVTAANPAFRPAPATFTVTVSTPGITLNTISDVGSGLQRPVSGSLGAGQHGGVALRIVSSNPGVLRVAPNTLTEATDSIVINIPNGSTSFSYVVAGMEGQTGTVTVSARATGFTDQSTTATVVTPAIGLSNISTGTSGTAGVTADRAFWVTTGIANVTNTGFQSTLQVRAGGSLTVNLTSSNGTVGPLITTAAPTGTTAATVTVGSNAFNSPTSVAAGGVAFRFASPGTATVAATASGFTALTTATATVTVNAP